MYCEIYHLMIASMSVLTSRWQNSASLSTHAGGDGDGGDGGGPGGGVAATARGGLGKGDGSGDDAVQYWQLSWHFSMSSWVLQFVILSMSVLALRWQKSASLSTHAGGEGEGGEPGGGGGDGEGGGPGEGDGSGDDTVQCPQLSWQAPTMKGSVRHLLILS